jgi:hypothetical protein
MAVERIKALALNSHRQDVLVILDLGLDREGFVAEVSEAAGQLLGGAVVGVIKVLR